MIDIAILLMLIIFLILFFANIIVDNWVFGAIAGLWLIIIALAILVDGVQLQSGMTMVTVGGNTTISYQYTDLFLPFPSPSSIIFGVFLIGISIYIIYKNALD